MSLALEWKQEAYRQREAAGRPRGGAAGEEAPRPRVSAAGEEALRARASRARTRRNRLLFACFCTVALAVSGLLVLSVFLQVSVAQNEMKTRRLEREIELEMRNQEAVRAEIAALESPGRIEKLAVETLKMVQVAQMEYLQTPAALAARAEAERNLASEEGILSDATQGNVGEAQTAGP